jgi:LemA protein
VIVVVILIVVVVLVLLYLVFTYNSLVSLRNRVDQGWSQVDVQLRLRYDLIPNLVETVKGYAAHERETLDAVIQARNTAVAASDVRQQSEAENGIAQALGRLFALAEAYPDLKANRNFLALQEELSSVEGKIAYARQAYNDQVFRYNTKIQKVPANMLASAFHFSERDFFEAEDDSRGPVNVAF